ncbi:DUF3298 domain-containing protein [Psychroserpens sp.]|uniref:DUF3298 and DUF4163 domain-containing protein n=1 Tax=Psychroserpens sp. TaxID=2020870 RepID=UPI00385A3F20
MTLVTIFSCKNEVEIKFIEENIETSKAADISINFPKAEGDKAVSELINSVIQNYIVSQTNLTDDSLNNVSIDEAVKRFNTEFKTFKNDFPESSQKWEAFIDGEVTYRSPEVICIAVNSYLDTGGAHGNTHIKFFNFNPQTGQLYSKAEIINDIQGLSGVITNKLKEEVKSNSDEPMEEFFFGKDFQLPESLGFSDEGLIVLYNPYEIASYSQGIMEFTIPFEDINSYFNIN